MEVPPGEGNYLTYIHMIITAFTSDIVDYPRITLIKSTELTLEYKIGYKEDIQLYITVKLRLKNTKAA